MLGYCENLVVTIAITIITTFSYDFLLKSDFFDSLKKIQISYFEFNEKEFLFVNYKENEARPHFYVKDCKAAEEIKNTLEQGLNRGGLYVLGAPPDSGKSAHLQEMLTVFLREHIHARAKVVQFDAVEVLSEEKLREKIGIPKNRAFSEFIPRNSWIIIDQFDRGKLKDHEGDFFTSLATSSANSRGGFSFMVVVSSPRVYKTILACNGKRKILPVCNPLDFQIDEKMMKAYISTVIPKADADRVVSQYGKFRSIGIIRSAILDGLSPLSKPDWESFSVVYRNFYRPNFFLSIRNFFV